MPYEGGGGGGGGRPAGNKNSSASSQINTAIEELLLFLEVAIHGVLYMRQAYPEAIFERRRKYDVPVFMSRHPDLNLYIREVLESAAGMLQEGSIDKFVVCFYDGSGDPIETVTFEMADSARLVQELARGAMDPSLYFRKMLGRISLGQQLADLGPLPEDRTFAILLSTKPNEAAMAGGHKGGAGGSGNTPEAWTSVVSSGQFAPAGPESYLDTSQSTTPISYRNLVNWDDNDNDGGGGTNQKHMRVVIRTKENREL